MSIRGTGSFFEDDEERESGTLGRHACSDKGVNTLNVINNANAMVCTLKREKYEDRFMKLFYHDLPSCWIRQGDYCDYS